jgi:hypothetical protein
MNCKTGCAVEERYAKNAAARRGDPVRIILQLENQKTHFLALAQTSLLIWRYSILFAGYGQFLRMCMS